MPGDSTDSRGHRAARLLWLREQEPGEENAPQRTGAPQLLGGGLPRCCHGTRHQHSQRLTSSDTQCTSCQDKGLQTCGRRQHKGVFSGAGAQKPEIKAVPSGGPEASLPAPGGSWRLLASHGGQRHHCKPRLHHHATFPSVFSPFLPLQGHLWDFPGGPGAKSQCRGPRFNPWSGDWTPHVATRDPAAAAAAAKSLRSTPYVTERRLWVHGCVRSTHAHCLRLASSRALQCMGSAAQRHVESSPTRDRTCTPPHWQVDYPQGLPCGSAGEESACNVGDLGSIPELGRSPGEGKGYPLQHSGLENSMGNIIVHGVPKSRTQMSNLRFAHLSTRPSRKSSFYVFIGHFSPLLGFVGSYILPVNLNVPILIF